ncbi:PREDICTED: squalene synthase-like [Thamnophis sirtalis]|uniref:Squalene synthase-like n=1 Tax=Thamnophis sirtalis TaxID=35019 RepID=A0A6I9Y4J0_9SAUR|nr:PREDICTED: squalene synthase-like [Thamnophis sirtalis]
MPLNNAVVLKCIRLKCELMLFIPYNHAVCIFYLVLRALDTVEDDMTISLEAKVPMLHNFHSYLYQPDWKFMDSREKDRQVLEDFPTISLEFRNLAKVYQDVITDICHKMGLGMAEFLEKKVNSNKEWDKQK